MGLTIKASGTLVPQLRELEGRLKRLPERLALGAGKIIRTGIGHEIDAWAENATGALANSFVVEASAKSSSGEVTTFEATISSDSPYALIHEFGGRIRPKRSRYLTIPLTTLARARSARAWGGSLIVIKSRNGNLLLIEKRKGGAPQYLLRNSVYIRPKRYISKALERARPKMKNLMGAELERTVHGGTGSL